MMARIDLYPGGEDFVAAGTRQAVDMATSMSPQMLLTPRNPYGSSFHDTLRTLGVDMTHLPLRTRFTGSPETIRLGIRPLRLELGRIADRAAEMARLAEEERGGTSANNGFVERSARADVASIVDETAQRLGKAYHENPETPLIDTMARTCASYADYLTSDGTRVTMKHGPMIPIKKHLLRSSLLYVAGDISRRPSETRSVETIGGEEAAPLSLTDHEWQIIHRLRASNPKWLTVMYRDPNSQQLNHRPLDSSDVVGYALRLLEANLRDADIPSPAETSE